MTKMQKVVKYKSGVVEDKNKEGINSQTEAWREEAKCGCGIDCCENELVLRDKTTGEKYFMYLDDSELFIEVGEAKYKATLTEQ